MNIRSVNCNIGGESFTWNFLRLFSPLRGFASPSTPETFWGVSAEAGGIWERAEHLSYNNLSEHCNHFHVSRLIHLSAASIRCHVIWDCVIRYTRVDSTAICTSDTDCWKPLSAGNSRRNWMWTRFRTSRSSSRVRLPKDFQRKLRFHFWCHAWLPGTDSVLHSTKSKLLT